MDNDIWRERYIQLEKEAFQHLRAKRGEEGPYLPGRTEYFGEAMLIVRNYYGLDRKMWAYRLNLSTEEVINLENGRSPLPPKEQILSWHETKGIRAHSLSRLLMAAGHEPALMPYLEDIKESYAKSLRNQADSILGVAREFEAIGRFAIFIIVPEIFQSIKSRFHSKKIR